MTDKPITKWSNDKCGDGWDGWSDSSVAGRYRYPRRPITKWSNDKCGCVMFYDNKTINIIEIVKLCDAHKRVKIGDNAVKKYATVNTRK